MTSSQTRSLCLAAVLAASAVSAADPEGEAQAVLQEQITAWNRGDLDAFCALYAEDAVFASPTGLIRGRQAVLARYRNRYPDRAAMGTLAFEVQDVRATGEAVSIVARWRLAYSDKPEASGLTLVVLRRMPQGWRLVQDASM